MAQHHVKSGEVVDLRPLGPKLGGAKTIALVKEKRFEAIRLIMRAGTEIPPHDVPGDLMLHCLEGRIVLGLAHSELELASGDWLYLNGGDAHFLKCLQDASLLLTVLLTPDSPRTQETSKT